jgi:hypothetical protein
LRHSRGEKASKRHMVADAEAAAAAAVPVALALPGDWCDDVGGSMHHTYTSHRHSRAGGAPAWPPHGPPPDAMRRCGECGAQRQLVLQSPASLSGGDGGDRVLYVLACLNAACSRTAATCVRSPLPQAVGALLPS